MLTTIFSMGGCNYKSSRIPESFESLKLAAAKILNIKDPYHRPDTTFQFSYMNSAMTKVKPILNDTDLMNALNQTFQDCEDTKIEVTFFIEKVL